MNRRSSLPRTPKMTMPETGLAPVIPPVSFGTEDIITSYRWGWYGLSLLVPFAGFFLAYLLYDQESREVRKVGRNCLLIAFLIWVVLPLVVLAGIILFAALTAYSMISNLLPSGD